MKSFLKYVAEDIIRDYGTDLSRIMVVFPNKRASLFLNEELMKIVQKPFWSPNYMTISDMFLQNTSLQLADPIKLICDLHKSFVKCTGVDETLDHFYGWGQLLLADFDDLDKNLGDARKIFINIADLHELDDDSYLDEEKRRILKKFFGNFKDTQNTELKRRFMALWNHLYDIYTDFNQRLASQGLAYEGALYRHVIEADTLNLHYDTYLFVGFNMMQQVETALYRRIKQDATCHFYWDYDKYYVGQNKNEAGVYINQYLKLFGNKLSEPSIQNDIYNNLNSKKKITYINAATENIQARYVNDWLMEKVEDDHGNLVPRYQTGRKTAIVLADENLLSTVIHSLPTEIDSHVNITLGYPLKQTPFYSLIMQLINLQTIGSVKGSTAFRLHYVVKALRHPYAKYISSNYQDLLNKIEEQKLYFLDRDVLCAEEDEGMNMMFADLEASEKRCLALIGYLVNILRLIGSHANDGEDSLFQESLFRTYTLINRLKCLVESGDLDIDMMTLQRLIQQLFQSTNVPFHGEPVIGVQIMGVLETRNLDFDHILVLSCNEGNLPKGVNDSSFIPYSIRKAHGLTTIDNKVAIFAYYFYRLIQRAQDVTLAYNSSTDEGHTGEMSRFMLQLLVESKHVIRRKTIVSGQNVETHKAEVIVKTPKMMEILDEPRLITPTFLNTYQRCAKSFYYKYILSIREPEELEDEMDNRMFGNIFHRAAQLFYLKFASSSDIKVETDGEKSLIKPIVITKGDIQNAIKDESLLYRLVDQAFKEELFKIKDQKKTPQYNGLQLINREVITNYLKQLLYIDMKLAPFTIKGLEIKVEKTFEFSTPSGTKILRLGGFIDRLDEVSASESSDNSILGERIRVIDYKTGRIPSSLPKEVESLFDPNELEKHTDYYLQAMLYSYIVKQSKKLNPANESVSPGLLFIQQSGASGYEPTLKFRKDYISDVSPYKEKFFEGLNHLISDIFDPNSQFAPTEDKKRCELCPYKTLCK